MRPKERNGPADERNAEAGGVAEQAALRRIARRRWVRAARIRRRDGLEFREDAGDLVVGGAERAENEQLGGGVGEHDPLASACSYERADG